MTDGPSSTRPRRLARARPPFSPIVGDRLDGDLDAYVTDDEATRVYASRKRTDRVSMNDDEIERVLAGLCEESPAEGRSARPVVAHGADEALPSVIVALEDLAPPPTPAITDRQCVSSVPAPLADSVVAIADGAAPTSAPPPSPRVRRWPRALGILALCMFGLAVVVGAYLMGRKRALSAAPATAPEVAMLRAPSPQREDVPRPAPPSEEVSAALIPHEHEGVHAGLPSKTPRVTILDSSSASNAKYPRTPGALTNPIVLSANLEQTFEQLRMKNWLRSTRP